MINNLWQHAPELRERARRQARNLRIYQDMARDPRYGGCHRDIGSRAGKLLALRMEAYDRLHANGGAR